MNLNLEFTDPIQWNQDDEYSINDVVFNGTDAYTAIDYVPSGTLLTNTAYWKKTGKFIRTQNLDNGAVTTEKIATNAVTTGKLAGKVVTTAKIDDAAVTADKLSDDALDDAIAMSGQGESVTTGNSSYLASLTVDGKAVQDGTPTPSAPVPVEVVQSINIWNEQFEGGDLDNTGQPTSNSLRIRSKDYISIIPSGSYFITNNVGYTSWFGIKYYDSSKAFISTENISNNSIFTAPSTARYIKFNTSNSWGSNTYNGGICINISDVSINGLYLPYGSIGLKVGSTITPINLQGNVLASLPDGTKDVLTVDSVGHCVLEKRVGVVDLGLVSWNDSTPANHVFRCNSSASFPDVKKPASANVEANAICEGFTLLDYQAIGANDDGCFAISNGDVSVFIDHRYSTIESFAVAMSGVMLYYQLAAPQTIDLGYIDMPAIPDGSQISITAQVTPTISASWWTRGAAAVPEALDDLDDSVISKLEPRIDDIASSIAVVENGETSSANYSVNDFIMRFDKLYQVTSAIATGESFVVDTNIEEKTVIEAIIAMIENM